MLDLKLLYWYAMSSEKYSSHVTLSLIFNFSQISIQELFQNSKVWKFLWDKGHVNRWLVQNNAIQNSNGFKVSQMATR